MIETNMGPRGELKAAAERLLAAAVDYRKVFCRVNGGTGVVWVKNSDGSMVQITRGEYQGALMRDIVEVSG